MHLFYGSKLDKSKVTVLTDPAADYRISVQALVVGLEYQDCIVEHLHKLRASQTRWQVADVHLPILLWLVREGHRRCVKLLVKVNGRALGPLERIIEVLVLRYVVLLAKERLEFMSGLLP